ncbi:MAG TPA: hypothetical protein PL124_12670, partial [Candidatus Cloacimonadota bacterium]|nr:hypothetical protein [Candidatus Cloacimonadota bacterium]
MKMALLTCLFLLLGCMAFALSSYTDTETFTLDTVAPSLALSSPNGGETWYIGDTHNITWTASDTNLSPNSVFLWYSTNNGSSYTPLAEGILNDGSELWTMPSLQSYNAKVKVRVADSYGNLSLKVSAAPFSITYVPPAAPEGVSVDTT